MGEELGKRTAKDKRLLIKQDQGKKLTRTGARFFQKIEWLT